MTTREFFKSVFEAKFELNEQGIFPVTDKMLRLIVLENPHLGIEVLEGMHPRADSQVTLLEEGIRVDYGYGKFEENRDSRYFKLIDFGDTWDLSKNYLAVSRNTYNKLASVNMVLNNRDNRMFVCNDLPDDQIYLYKFPALYRIL